MNILNNDDTVVVMLTVNFPGDYVREVYGTVNDDIASELLSEYLAEVNLNDLMPEWLVLEPLGKIKMEEK